MSNTADIKHWDSNSQYHSLRAADAKSQVSNVLLPVLAEVSRANAITSVVDFACGAGAIAAELVEASAALPINIRRFGLMDANEDNLPPARERLFSAKQDLVINTHKANGNNFEDFSMPKYDFFYSWDAMVHFDIIDVVGYVKSLGKIVSGHACIHHSNLMNITHDIRDNPHWRNFMGKDVFAQICISAGHSIVWQREFDWGLPKIDCITLLKVN